jgi:hypothetical protein
MVKFRSDFTEAVAFQFRWAHRANVNLVENKPPRPGQGTVTSADGACIHQPGLRLEF